jgi:peptidyl-prolyl cis-trans isomerase D
MAAIGSIRKHSTMLVIVIGVALAAFILGDFAKRRGRHDVNVGVIDGQEVTIMDFNKKFETNLDNTKRQKQTTTLTSAEQASIRNQTWEQLVKEIIMGEEFNELGIDVTADELFDMIQGPNPDPLIVQSFTDPNTGVFDRSRVINYLKNLDNMPPEAKQQWLDFEKYLKEKRMQEKFNALISKGYYVPKALAMNAYREDNDRASVSFVASKIMNVPDSIVTVTDDDYRTYYDANKEKFKQAAGCDIDFVIFKVTPSQRDIQKAKKEIVAIAREFKQTDDVDRFMKVNSDTPYDSTWKTKSELPVEIDSVMFAEKPGFVSNYWFSNNTYYVARLMDKQMRPDSIEASHILIAYKGAFRANPAIDRTKEEAEKLADSLLNLFNKRKAKLSDLAVTYSDDPSAKQNNGDLGWFKDGAMVPGFNNACIETKVGKYTLAETPFGYHVIKVTGKKEPVEKVKVAILTLEVVPGNETYQNTFADASKLASENKTEEAFNKAVEEMHLTKLSQPKIHEMTSNIRGYENVRQVVRWAFNEDTEIGSVSDVFDLEGAYMVAVVTNKYSEGVPTLEELKPMIARSVLNVKKGEYLANKMKAAGSDLNQISKSLNLPIEEDNALVFSARSFGSYGREQKAIGTSFGLDKGSVSKPVVDRSAVFVIKLNNIVASDAEKGYVQKAKKMEHNFTNMVNNDLPYRALQKATEIEDNRIKFF